MDLFENLFYSFINYFYNTNIYIYLPSYLRVCLYIYSINLYLSIYTCLLFYLYLFVYPYLPTHLPT
jgi:hypothetical protein